MRKQSLLELIINGIIFISMVGSLAQSLFTSLYLPAPFYKTLLIGLIFYIILSILFIRLRITLPIVMVILIILWLFNSPLPEDWSARVLDFLQWAALYPIGLISFNESFVFPFVLLVTGILSLILFIFAIKRSSFIISLIIGAVLLGTEWFYGHTQITPYLWIFSFSLIVIMASKRYRSLPISAHLADHGLWLAWVLPLSIIIILTAFIAIPKDTTHLKWQALEDITDEIREKRFGSSVFTDPRQPFRLSSTGFAQSNEELGGPVKIEGDVALKVRSSIPTYLRGSVLNTYTGTSWKDTTDDRRYNLFNRSLESVKERAYDLDEAMWKDQKAIDRLIEQNLLVPYHISIEHVGLKSSVLFNAQFVHNIMPGGKNSFVPYFNNKGESFTSRDLEDQEFYIIEGIIPNIGNQKFKDLIEEYSNLSINTAEDIEESNEISKQNYIEQNYTQLPDTIPKRVVDLSLTITEDALSPFDKAIKIQNYLMDNFSYTLDTPYTPPGRDFVDYFLFDLQEGYCTYFATAMAVMGRAVGLPVRYIEGFAMPPKPYLNDMYNVRKSDAHAWVEVYFPNIGWIPFDPTPRSQVVNGVGSPGIGPSYTNYWEEYLRQNRENNQTPNLDLDISESSHSKSESKSPWIAYTLFISLAVMLLALLVLLCYRYYILKLKPRKFSNRKKLLFYYQQILWLLSLYGFPLQSGETPYGYAQRVDTWLINQNTNMTNLTKILMECQFGFYTPTKEQISIIENFYNDLEKDTISIIGLPLFIYESIKKILSPS